MKKNINEGKQGLRSKKLYDILKAHGGFRDSKPSFYLHDMTDDDVIGVVDDTSWNILYRGDWQQRVKWAASMGYNVGRGDNIDIYQLKDDSWVALIERGGNLGNDEYLDTKVGKLKRDRYNNRLNRGDLSYQWSDTGKWGSPRQEEFYMRRTQNNIANKRRERYGDDAVYNLNNIKESIEGLEKFATPTDITRFTNNLVKKLYKVSQPYTSHRFRDNDWRHLKTFIEILRNVEGVEELIPAGTGPYKQSQEGVYKEYTLDITTTLGSKIGGFIRCHFCGSQENPWDVYDMTVNFYRNNELNNDNIMMNESKQGIQSKKLYDAVKEHGGFGEDWKNKMYVHGITDNDIIGIFSPEEYKNFLRSNSNYRDLINNVGITPVDKLDRIKTCSFKDGFKIIYILRNKNNIEATSKKVNRGQNAPYSSGKRPYMYSDKDRQKKVNKMKQVVIKEDELQKIINESIKKRINELSSELLHKAALKAGQKAFDAHKSGDDKQGMRKMKQAGNLSKGSDAAKRRENK